MNSQELVLMNLRREDLDTSDNVRHGVVAKFGLSEEVVRLISKFKKEPDWMLQIRLSGLKYWNEKTMPTWGPDLSKLDVSKIRFFAMPETGEKKSWADVPEEIKRRFEKLGIPEAEQKYLAGAGAQMESGMVYHNLQKIWADKGIIFENMDVALQKYPELIKKYFMTKCVPINDHKFAALHAAVWSGGTFLYIPKNVKLDMPVQAYFRMDSEGMGQFEHTLIVLEDDAEGSYIEGCSAPKYNTNSLHAGCVEVYVGKNSRFRYTSVENWSKNTYNLNTKRAIVEENSTMEWIGGNMGSCTTMLYPCSILKGKNSRANHISIAFAGAGQNQDTGGKVIHLAEGTSSVMKSKSISKDGGLATFRGLVKVTKQAQNSKVHVACDALLLDEKSKNNTIPTMEIKADKVDVAHEATVGKISDEQKFYLMSRGLTEEEALAMIVNGFLEPITKQLPLEYAVEMNRLIELEMEGSVG